MAQYLVQAISFLKARLSQIWDFSATTTNWVLFSMLVAVFGSIHLILRDHLQRPERKRLFQSKSFLHYKDFLRAIYTPLSYLFVAITVSLIFLSLIDNYLVDHNWYTAVDTFLNLNAFVALFWFSLRMIHLIVLRIQTFNPSRESKSEALLYPLITSALQGTLIVIGFNVYLQVFRFPEDIAKFLAKMGSILMIGIITWFLIKVTLTLDELAQLHFNINEQNNLQARKVHTQVHIIQKILIFFIGLIAIACTLLLFDEVRKFGTTLLASAGLAGIALGFAAQQTIANLLAGIQIAITQPIRLDDVVIVENEWGRIEEISLTYVVVRVWDLRRLVLPISYFTSKPFQNWTRTASEILGTVFFYLDYSVSVDLIRTEAEAIVKDSPLWDGKTFNVLVVDTTERCMQVRVLVSARSSGDAFDLRCHIREKIIHFIQKNHPHALPHLRLTSSQAEA